MAAPAPSSNYTFHAGSFPIDQYRPMKVVIVGAGYSGIIAGVRFLQRVPNIQLTIYDKNSNIGGTWFTNRYPGLACDIPSHVYQLTFEEKRNWSSFYSPGAEILSYLESVVKKYDLKPYMKLGHCLTKAQYSEESGKWNLTLKKQSENRGDSVEIQDTCDILFTALGILSRWSWPEISGLSTFKGKLIHSAEWDTGEGEPRLGWEDTVKTWGNKRVGVIGVGSSAIQIVPALQRKVAQLVNYVRGKTWVSVTFTKENLSRLAKREDVDNYNFTADDFKMFEDDDYYKKFRRELENDLNSAHMATMRGSEMQNAGKILFREIMIQKLAKKPWIADHILPDFSVACRRLTPGPGYLEALCEDNVEFVPELIKQVTPSGIDTVDGKHQDLDVIICATGFDTSFQLPFPIIGRDGVTLAEKYKPHPRTYLSIAVDGFPNWFQAGGPNSGVGAGSLLILFEKEVDYAVAATLKLQRERLKSIEVKKEAVAEFDDYIESYFPTSVFGEKCRSWYKMGKEEGRVVALWPGSCLHMVKTLSHPRWEDFKYEYLEDTSRNRFHWLGNGLTRADLESGSDKAWYLADKEVDHPPLRMKLDML